LFEQRKKQSTTSSAEAIAIAPQTPGEEPENIEEEETVIEESNSAIHDANANELMNPLDPYPVLGSPLPTGTHFALGFEAATPSSPASHPI